MSTNLPRIEKLYGPPGTGKTTALLNTVERYIQAGVKPEEIAYLAFTVKAAHEAISRASARFGLDTDRFPHFRTIHSWAFRHLGLSTSQVLKRKHYSNICERLGYEYSGYVDLEEGQTATALLGDRLLFMEGLAKARMVPYVEQHDESLEDISWFEFQLLCDTLTSFKEAYHVIDFNDMLERCLLGKVPGYRVLIVDEAQDLSNLQWALLLRIIDNSEDVYVAGDDDQAIFRWAGANPDRFIGLPGSERVLAQSFRVPAAVHGLAQRIAAGISRRPDKPYLHRPGSSGQVHYPGTYEELPLDAGEWLILARNSYLLKEVQEECIRSGRGYVGKAGSIFLGSETGDPDYVPNCRISTIHGAKGAEAQNVAVFTDVSFKTWNAMQLNLDDELRTFYVAVTRAKENLWVIGPRSNNYVEFLHI